MTDLHDKQFNRILDGYLMTGEMKAEDYENLTRPQKVVIQCIKRAFARLKSNQ